MIGELVVGRELNGETLVILIVNDSGDSASQQKVGKKQNGDMMDLGESTLTSPMEGEIIISSINKHSLKGNSPHYIPLQISTNIARYALRFLELAEL